MRGNREEGVLFRNETKGMPAHRNRLERKVIENNGEGTASAGLRVLGETHDLVYRNHLTRDTGPPEDRQFSK